MKKLVFAAMLLLGLSILLSCHKEPGPEPVPEPVKVTAVTLSSSSMTLVEGESQVITATVSPSNADNKKVIWTTSNSSVATVNEGTVKAVRAGTATITATTDDGGKTATCTVEVTARVISVTGVSLDKTQLELTEGDEATLVATVTPDNASNKNVEWRSSDEDVVTVQNGQLTAIHAGSATIIVSTEDGGKTATCSVTVTAKTISVTGVTVSPTSASIEEGSTKQLTATVLPSNATNKKVSWSSTDTSVATVSGSGLVTAVKPGSVTIIVSTEDGGKTATCSVTVTAKTISVTGVTVSPTSASIEEGSTKQLTATVLPSNATNKKVSWSSTDTSVATVSGNGLVTAGKPGTANIIVSTEDGGKTATCSVTVTKKANLEDPVEGGDIEW